MDDGFFGEPWVDVDEWRESPYPHRYVHGGFNDTETLFSFYFIRPEEYEGRFLQQLEGGFGGHEHTVNQVIGADLPFAASCGAYLVESNQGHMAERDADGDRKSVV